MNYEKLVPFYNAAEAPEDFNSEVEYFMNDVDREGDTYEYTLADAFEDIDVRFAFANAPYLSRESIKYFRKMMINAGFYAPVDMSVDVYGMKGLMSKTARTAFVVDKIPYEYVG